MILSLLNEPNKLTGYALWEALTLLVDYSTGGITNQRGCPDYDETKPQGIGLCCIDDNREELGPNFYHYSVDCEIQPGVEIAEHLVTLSVTEKLPGCEIISQQIYKLKVSRFRALYPHLLTPDRDKYLAILEPVDFNEWWPDD